MNSAVKHEIYLDYAATTPLDPRVREIMLPYLGSEVGFGNPSSTTHTFGRSAKAAIDNAACEVATVINAQEDELIWTSCATEANNLAIIGAAQFRQQRGKHIVTSATEHKSVLGACAQLESLGFQVTYLQPDEFGLVATDAIARAIRDDTVLVSIAHANNETGVMQDIAAVGELCQKKDVLLHVDAAQTIGRVPIDVKQQQIDLLTMNAHKACGPKGIGALYLSAERIRRVQPLLFGGGQQRGLRPGTLATHQIVGMGAAIRIAAEEMPTEMPRVTELCNQLWDAIKSSPGVTLNGSAEQRLGSILNVSVARVDGESLRFALSGLAVASGSACNSATDEPSYVLRSMGRSDVLAEASIRFSLGRFTRSEEIARAGEIFSQGVKYLQSLSAEQPAA